MKHPSVLYAAALPQSLRLRRHLAALLFALSFLPAVAQPPMGWMTWNQFQDRINEQLIREVADAMVSEGYLQAGYNYIFIDDCWQGGRDNRNNLVPDAQKFPSGMRALADYVHARGLKLGIYSDAAQLTCAGYTASYGFEQQDARTFAEWGIDYLKYDYCNAPADSAEAHRRYRLMADALQQSGRDIKLGICEWGQHQAEHWARQAGGLLFRTSGDVRDMWRDTVGQGGMGILDIVNITAPLQPYAQPGCWLDMDMLVVGLYGKGGPSSDLGGTGCTDTEYQTQMSLWAMMASPLAMSHDLRPKGYGPARQGTEAEESHGPERLVTEMETTRRILLNTEVIAIDQDPLGICAERKLMTDDYQVFVRPLANGRHAVAVLNTSDQPLAIRLDFSQLGLTGKYGLRDPWLHRDLKKNANGWKGRLASHETKLLILQ